MPNVELAGSKDSTCALRRRVADLVDQFSELFGSLADTPEGASEKRDELISFYSESEERAERLRRVIGVQRSIQYD